MEGKKFWISFDNICNNKVINCSKLLRSNCLIYILQQIRRILENMVYVLYFGQSQFCRLEKKFVLFSSYKEQRYWISLKLKKTKSQSCFWHTLCTEKLGKSRNGLTRWGRVTNREWGSEHLDRSIKRRILRASAKTPTVSEYLGELFV